jgi:hypothetical protein
MTTRSRSTIATFLIAVLLSLWASAPVRANNIRIDLIASGARTAAGQGTTVDVTSCHRLFVLVSVTAGSGTVNPFKVYLEGTTDGGITWSGLHCARQSKRVTAAPTTTFIATGGAGDGLIVNEAAVVSAATTYAASCDVNTDTVRLGWEIAGTTPSETFSAQLVCK